MGDYVLHRIELLNPQSFRTVFHGIRQGVIQRV